MAILRRAKAAVGIAAIFVLFLAGGCGKPALLTARWHLFGSEAEIQIATDGDEELAHRALAALATMWNEFHRDWHPFAEGPLTRLNAALAAGRWSDPLPPSLLRLIESGSRIERATGGLVAPALGELYGLFHRQEVLARTDRPEMQSAIRELLAKPPRLSDLERRGDRLRSRHPRLLLDLSAIAEGQALAEGADLLRRHGIRNALLLLGGEAYALGQHPSGRPWRVALRHPQGGLFALVDLRDGEGLFAAGTYARFREDGGRRMAHIFDPRSGEALSTLATAAVLHRDPVLADGAATALLIGGKQGFPDLVHRLGIRCALYLEVGKGLAITAAMRARLQDHAKISGETVYDAGADCDSAATR